MALLELGVTSALEKSTPVILALPYAEMEGGGGGGGERERKGKGGEGVWITVVMKGDLVMCASLVW